MIIKKNGSYIYFSYIYSVISSQPKKSHLPLQVDGSRIRAYSVGSQAYKKGSNIDRELGNLVHIDPRTGTKSFSAPLLNNRPPRIRSSTSRGEVKEDLMEIDYNRAKYTSGGMDILDSNFTIEPVGRSRSGSYSSSPSNALKLLLDRDKTKSHSTGHSCHSSRDDSQSTSDYLSMSPVSDHGKSLSRSSVSGSPSASPSMNVQVPTPKRTEPLHPPGDYVSLDPSSMYQAFGGQLKASPGPTFRSQRSRSPSSLSTTPPPSVTSTDAKVPLSQVSGIASQSKCASSQPNASDYMCMNYNTPQSSSSQPVAESSDTSDYFLCGPSSSSEQEPGSRGDPLKCHPLPQVKESSPTLKSPSPSGASASFLPRTPPPSPSYGAMSSDLSGGPFLDNLVRRLSQPSSKGGNRLPDSPPYSSGEVRLNYASLDLPPPSEEDGKGPKLRKSLEGETKEASPTYAQIDFSPMKQKPFQDSENLSHL